MTFGENLKALRKARGLTQEEFAKQSGISRSAIGMYESGKREPKNFEMLETIADFFNVDMNTLLGTSAAPAPPAAQPPTVQPSTTEHPATNSYVHIPVLGAIPAGIPSEAIESVLDYEDIPADMAKHGNFYGLIARGHSMEPTINDGDVVIIRQQPTVESGEIAVVKLNGNEATLKEVKITDEGIFIIGHNRSAFEPMFLTHEQAKSLPLRILGKAVELRRTLGK